MMSYLPTSVFMAMHPHGLDGMTEEQTRKASIHVLQEVKECTSEGKTWFDTYCAYKPSEKSEHEENDEALDRRGPHDGPVEYRHPMYMY